MLTENIKFLLDKLNNEDEFTNEVDLSKETITEEIAIELASALAKNTLVTKLYIGRWLVSRNNISIKALKVITEALCKNRFIKFINFGGCHIGEIGAQYIAFLLENNKFIETIELASNELRDEGVMIIAKALEENKTLKYLNLRDNEIGVDGAQVIAKMLRTNSTLRSIQLTENHEMTVKGLKAIAESLKFNHSLIELSLVLCSINNLSIEAIGNMLLVNTSLRNLHLQSNQIGKRGAELIAEALEKNNFLEEIALYGNEDKLTKEGMEILIKVTNGPERIKMYSFLELEEQKHRLKEERENYIEPEIQLNASLNINHHLKNQPVITTTVYSSAESKLPVTYEHWAISVMRKPYGKNPDHAFLVIEGINQFGRGLLLRFDLVDNEEKPGYALIVDKTFQNIDPKEMKTVFCKDLMKQEKVYCKSWSITHTQALSLIQDIQQDKIKMIKYYVSGDKSIFVKSTSNDGHSCFTWAREKLHNLNDERIQLPEKWTDFIAAKTSFYIDAIDNQHQKNPCLIM